MNWTVLGRVVASGVVLTLAFGAPGAVHAKPRAQTLLTMEVADSPALAYDFARVVNRLSTEEEDDTHPAAPGSQGLRVEIVRGVPLPRVLLSRRKSAAFRTA
jgi:hypothetical protein